MYLGIDGGGTLTRALLVNELGEILGAGQSGPSNIHQVEPRTIRRNIQKAINGALMEVGDADYTLATACYGLAGSSAPEARTRLEGIIAKVTPAASVATRVTTDAEIALGGGLLGESGLLLIAGTGSICLGRDNTGTVHRTGGWGFLADDGGGALSVGRQAIEHAVRQADGRQPLSKLGTMIFKELGIGSVDDIVSVLYSPKLTKTKIGQLAPTVMQLAVQGDGVALSIANTAIDEISNLIRTTLKKTNLTSSEVVAVGGMMTEDSWFRKAVESAVTKQAPGTTLRSPELPPVAGAIIEARKMDAATVDAAFINNLRKGIEFFSQ